MHTDLPEINDKIRINYRHTVILSNANDYVSCVRLLNLLFRGGGRLGGIILQV